MGCLYCFVFNNKYKTFRILLYTAIVLPYRISFVDQDSDFNINLDIVMDCIFGCDIVFNFFSAYVDNEDNVIKNRKVFIAFFYYFVENCTKLP